MARPRPAPSARRRRTLPFPALYLSVSLLSLGVRRAAAQLSIPSLGVCDMVDIHDPAGVGVPSWGLEVWFGPFGQVGAVGSPIEVVPCYGPDCYWRVDVPETSVLSFCSNLTQECPSTSYTVGASTDPAPSSWGGSQWCMAKNTGAVTSAIMAEVTDISLSSVASAEGSTLPSSTPAVTTSPPASGTGTTASTAGGAGGGGSTGASGSGPSGTAPDQSTSPTATAAAGHGGASSHAGAIAGGTVAGVVVVALLAALLFLCCRRSRHHNGPNGDSPSGRPLISSPKSKYAALGSWGRGSWKRKQAPTSEEAPEMASRDTPDALGRSWAPQPPPAYLTDRARGEYDTAQSPPSTRAYPWTRGLPTWGQGADPFRRGSSGVRVMSGELNPIAEEWERGGGSGRYGRTWGSTPDTSHTTSAEYASAEDA